MNTQDLHSMRAMIAAHKRWDLMFGVLGILALMIGLMTFVALFADMTIHGFGRIERIDVAEPELARPLERFRPPRRHHDLPDQPLRPCRPGDRRAD